jgi:hypothetical protein
MAEMRAQQGHLLEVLSLAVMVAAVQETVRMVLQQQVLEEVAYLEMGVTVLVLIYYLEAGEEVDVPSKQSSQGE